MGIKYFFGYYPYHGLWGCNAWMEDDGLPVGVMSRSVDIVEITREEFCLTLDEMVKKYPRKTDEVPTPELK